jgi:hypothetical protein
MRAEKSARERARARERSLASSSRLREERARPSESREVGQTTISGWPSWSARSVTTQHCW